MGERLKKTGKTILPYAAVELMTVFILLILYHGADIAEPLLYEGDALGSFQIYKSICAKGFSYISFFFGSPDSVSLTEMQNLLAALLSNITGNPFLIDNLIFFFGFLAASMTAFYVFRKLGMDIKYAAVLALLYDFIPYHQYRLVHPSLALYFAVPFVLLMAINMTSDDEEKWKLCPRNFIPPAIWLMFLYSSSLYYTAFTCLIFVMTAVINLLNRKKTRQILLPILPVMELILLFVIQNIRYFWNVFFPKVQDTAISASSDSAQLTVTSIATGRIPGEADVYGLRLMQMLLPRPGHRLSVLASLQDRYHQNYPLVNENSYAAMGVIAAAVFIMILAGIFIRKMQTGIKWQISRLAIGIFLIGTMGGIGAIFNSVIKNPIRCYNRLSIFIEFLCFAYLGLLLTERKLKSVIAYLVCGSVLFIGIFDQTTSFTRNDQKNVCAAYYEDKDFFKEIENSVPDESTVCIIMPETDSPYGYSDAYRLNLCDLYTEKNIKWIRKTDIKISDVAKELQNNYGGIFVDISVCRSKKTDYQEFIREISKDLGEAPVYSSKKNMAYFKICETGT